MLDSLSDPVFLVTIPFQEQSEWSHWRWKFQVPCLHSSRRCWRTQMVWRDTEVGEERLGRRSKWSREAVVQVNLWLPFPPLAAAPHPAAPHPHLTELLHSFCMLPRQKKGLLTLWGMNPLYINQPGANCLSTTVAGGVGQTGTPRFCV